MATDINPNNENRYTNNDNSTTSNDINPTSRIRLVKPVIFGLIITGIIVLCIYLLQGNSYDSSDFHNVDPVEEPTTTIIDDSEGQEDILATTDNIDENSQLPANEEIPSPKADKKEDTALSVANPQNSTEVKQKIANSLEGYLIEFGKYSGPAENGKPSGAGGIIKVTKPFTIDLKNGGSGLQVEPGDEIIDCKYRNGKLIQGKVIKKNGESRFFSIGI